MANANELRLLHYVQAELRAGKSRIEIPAELLNNARDEVLKEIKALVKISGAKIVKVNIEMSSFF